MLREAKHYTVLADPEGNELCLCWDPPGGGVRDSPRAPFGSGPAVRGASVSSRLCQYHDDMVRRRLAGGLVASLFVLALAPVAGSTAAAPSRQAARWPFAASSPWNVGVGKGAVFERVSDPRTSSLLDRRMTPWVNAERYSHPVYRATTSDPMAVVRQPGRPDRRYRIPSAARPAAGSDAHLHVVDPSGRLVEEAWAMRGANPTWTAGYQVSVDLLGSGFGRGTRASGASALGGLIRRWEVEAGEIRHALALSLDARQLRRGPVWPAHREDGDADAYRGAVPMGTYAAIPGWVDLHRLGLSHEGLVLGRALKRYGAFVVDRAGGSFALSAEPSVPGPALGRMRADLGKLRPWLRVVANSGPQRVNGGGGHHAAPAPPFG